MQASRDKTDAPSNKAPAAGPGEKQEAKKPPEDSSTRAYRTSVPGAESEEEDQPLTGKEMVLASREYSGTELVLSTGSSSNHTVEAEPELSPPKNPLGGAPAKDASATIKKSRFAPTEITVAAAANQSYSAPGEKRSMESGQEVKEGFAAKPTMSARRPRTFASMGSLRDRDGKLKGMESVNVSRRGAGQGEWAPGSPRTPLSEQNVRIEFLRNESRPLSPKIKMWGDIKDRVASMLMFKSVKQKPLDESKRESNQPLSAALL